MVQYDDVFMEGKSGTDVHTGRMPCEEKGRDRGAAFTSQGTPKIVGKPPEAGRRGLGQSLAHSPKRDPSLAAP